MGQAGFTIAGQVIGSYFFGPVGGAIGGALGSVIGGALFNEDQVIEGQRLSDLKVQSSTYGIAIPLIYGSARVAGNLIWCSELRETRLEEDVSASQKGGPSAIQVRYSYDVDVAIALCEGEIVDIERIYANGILIWDRRLGVDAATVYASGQWATGIYLYRGDETQLPDPTIEAAVGVGNAQGYRGTAYVVITALQLNKLKTASIPNFEFVVIQNGTPTQYSQKFVTSARRTYCGYPTHAHYPNAYVHVEDGVVRVFSKQAFGTAIYPQYPTTQLWDLNGNVAGETDFSTFESSMPEHAVRDDFGILVWAPPDGLTAVTGTTIRFYLPPLGETGYDESVRSAQELIDQGFAKVFVALGGYGSMDAEVMAYQTKYGGLLVDSADLDTTDPWFQVHYPPGGSGAVGASQLHYERFSFAPGMYVYPNAYGGGGVQADLDMGSGQLATTFLPSFDPPDQIYTSFSISADGSTVIALTIDELVSVHTQQWHKFRKTPDGYVLESSGDVSQVAGERIDYVMAAGGPASTGYAGGNHNSAYLEGDNRWLWFASGFTGDVSAAHIDDDGILRIKHTFSGVLGLTPAESSPTAIYADNGLCYIVVLDELYCYSREGEIEGDGIPLSEIVADVCDRSEIDAAEYDVTQLTPIVRGYAIGQIVSGRQAIETLRPAFYFDAVDGDKLKFVMRGGATVADFAFEDIGLESDQFRVASEFTQETERPARVNVRYISQAADYQIGAQSARRETTNSRETLDIDCPIVFSDDEAAQVADVNLRDQWVGSSLRSWKSSTEYSHIEPTDVVTVDDGTVVRTVRVTSRNDQGLLIEWKGIDEDVATYDSNAVGGAVVVPDQSVAVVGATEVEVLDLPPLTETRVGGESANYVAARGLLPGWSLASIEVSRNAGATFSLATTIDTASIMGVTQTELGDFTAGNVFDESNIVRVWASGALVSLTHDEVLDGGNACVIGDEILQFREATLVDDGVYDLSGLLRGRKGTEWAIGDHVAGDRFVMLTTNLGNITAMTEDRYSTDLRVRGVSAGASSASAAPETFETQLARLMPYSPVHLSGVQDDDGNWTLTWVRRDRYHNDWNDGSDVPMSEESELYDVGIYDDDGNLVKSYSNLTEPTVSVPYTVLGAMATEINFKVWQKSSVVGRGFEADATAEGVS